MSPPGVAPTVTVGAPVGSARPASTTAVSRPSRSTTARVTTAGVGQPLGETGTTGDRTGRPYVRISASAPGVWAMSSGSAPAALMPSIPAVRVVPAQSTSRVIVVVFGTTELEPRESVESYLSRRSTDEYKPSCSK